MCKKHSFLLDKKGKIYHGFGLIESHYLISKLNNIDEDKCNKYEYNPNNNNERAYGISGLKIDNEIFISNKTIIDKIEKYIKKMFPNIESWDNYSNFSITTELLAKLADNPYPDVRYEVAMNPKTTTELLDKLADDPDPDVRYEVAINPKTTTELLAKLADDQDYSVRRAVVENPKITTELLAKLANDPCWDVRCAVARHPDITIELLDKLSSDRNSYVRCVAAENPNYKK